MSEKIFTRNFHLADSHTLTRYRETGGCTALPKAFGMEPAAITEEVKKANLRGLGGAAFPTGVKVTDIGLLTAEQGEEFGLCQAGLLEHLMEERGRNVACHLVAQPDEQDFSSGERLLPGFVLLAADESKAGTLNDHPELPVGGRCHPSVEECARSGWGRVGSERPDVRRVRYPVGALTEPVELGRVLLGVIERHLDEVGEGRVGRVTLGGQVELRAERDERPLGRLDDGRELDLRRLEHYCHVWPPQRPAASISCGHFADSVSHSIRSISEGNCQILLTSARE